MVTRKKKSSNGWGFRRIGKRKGTTGPLSAYELRAKPYEFAYGTVWATSAKSAKLQLKRELKKKKVRISRKKKKKR